MKNHKNKSDSNSTKTVDTNKTHQTNSQKPSKSDRRNRRIWINIQTTTRKICNIREFKLSTNAVKRWTATRRKTNQKQAKARTVRSPFEILPESSNLPGKITRNLWDFMEMKLQIGEKREIGERKMGIWENLHRNLKWKEKEILRGFKSEYWKREVRNAWRWKGLFIHETGLGKRKMGAVTASPSPPYVAAFIWILRKQSGGTARWWSFGGTHRGLKIQPLEN